MTRIVFATLLVVLTASGCARNTDSRTAGFVNGLFNQVDGTYEQQRADLRAANEASAADNERLAARNENLESERAQLARDTRYARKKLSSLRAMIANAKSRHTTSSAQYQAAERHEAELNQLEKDVEAGNRAGDSGRVSAAARNLARLERELE